jgi:hypothetical protein
MDEGRGGEPFLLEREGRGACKKDGTGTREKKKSGKSSLLYTVV